ncbi:MAG TPA: fumarylacetoacetate hydrolase family protein [Actinomycetes bacterium]|jgi:2-keto-4-pentenoate hydratase/2-oxohepta-3-ene-1,7-dioic acid hydratase in catechol pathway|nr:fumarylacetoacetate hydrolase family protein [Actinomycetes bacterium]
MRIARYRHGQDVGFGVLEDTTVAAISPHPFGPFHYTGARVPLEDVRLLAPVLPTKVVAVGRNYAEHAREMGVEVGAEPVIFLKPSTAVIGPGDPIVYPTGVDRVDYEGELAAIIGKLTRRVDEADAMQAVLGFACANDVTARNLQKIDGQWTRAKGFDTFCPLGPWIETDLDSSDLAVRTLVDGEARQSSRTSMLQHGVASLIAFVSSVMTLLPGDVLLTGTPGGVGPLQVGSRVEVEVEGIGVLANPVVAEPL